jgi:hypothetical protein
MRVLVLLTLIIGFPAVAADYSSWPGHENAPVSSLQLAQKADSCCKHCTKGQPCGNTCISAKAKCKTPPGCAC